jgi:uncharacterized membrane protein (DUF106 family)
MDAIREWLAVGAVVVSVVVWLVRLEGRATVNSRDLIRLEQRLKEQRREDIDSRAIEHTALMKQLGDMREEMRSDLRDLRKDLKDAMSKP